MNRLTPPPSAGAGDRRAAGHRCARRDRIAAAAASLHEAAHAAVARGEPLVLLASLPGCPYCERIRRSHLLLLLRESGGGVYQIDVGSSASVIYFDGKTRTPDAVADSLHARFTPTVLFLGKDGEELSERLVGAGIPDFYGALLEQRRDAARTALRSR